MFVLGLVVEWCCARGVGVCFGGVVGVGVAADRGGVGDAGGGGGGGVGDARGGGGGVD